MKKFLILFCAFIYFSANSEEIDAQTNGLFYSTYLAGGPMPGYTQAADGTINNRTLLSSGTVSTINYQWGGGAVLNSGRAEGVIVRFHGFINIPTAGTYSFGGQADDGIRIRVNNTQVVNSWIESGGEFRTGSVNLPAGTVPIELIYYENGGGAMVNLQWFQNNNWQIVPTTSLATTATYWQPAVVVNITAPQQTNKTNARNRQTLANQIYINQVGSYNNVEVLQSGTYHLTDITIQGDSNAIGLDQLGWKNYANININGSSNTTNVFQSNSGTSSSPGHFSSVGITGNTNTVNVSQTGDAEKTSFVLVNGNNNNVTNNQFGTGTKYSDIKTTGNGHTVSLDQKDAGSHSARIEVTNSGGSSTVNVLQQGNTNQTYLLQQSCANAGGCSVTMTQQ
jgi:hypothetical protein